MSRLCCGGFLSLLLVVSLAGCGGEGAGRVERTGGGAEGSGTKEAGSEMKPAAAPAGSDKKEGSDKK
jgi:hypothetical protein